MKSVSRAPAAAMAIGTERPQWIVVIPVKGTADAKSRLGASPELALALALDTVEAATGAARIIVVTSADAAPAFDTLGAARSGRLAAEHVSRSTRGLSVVTDTGEGLGSAVALGVQAAIRAAGDPPVAVLLGDLPALSSAELSAVLDEAARHPLAVVPDADGHGTVLLTALRASWHAPVFGPSSLEKHLAVGYVEVDVPADSGLRRDVDLPEHLAALAAQGRLGPRTTVLACIREC